jgi:16S rRNA (adenine1518-N6/adenine1519-N6)-dimethyltransferase
MSERPAAILRRHGLRPKKEWGQNFLWDDRYQARIAQACALCATDTVVELGAGLGHLTRQLAATGAQVVAVERDRELLSVLEAELSLPNVRIVAANAAAVDLAEIASVARPVVAGNLPYHLSSSVLFAVLEQRARVKRAVFLLQREVAARIAAQPGGREYGLLAVLLQAYAEVSVLFDVPAGAFDPPPKVDSAAVRIDLLAAPRAEVQAHDRFVQVVKAAFSRRRKRLSNALQSDALLGDAAAIRAALARADIDPGRRAETLSTVEFAALARAFGEAAASVPK